jgi:tetratricopeptide (TPR) repeat protein
MEWIDVKVVLLLAAAGVGGRAFAQSENGQASAQAGQSSGTGASTPAKTPKRVTAHDSVVVNAKLTAEEREEGKLNDMFQPVSTLAKNHNCEAAVEKFQSDVIPAAEKAKFAAPRSKFLFLAYRGIADCYLGGHRYAEAEETYQKLFEYLPVWPGIDDSDHPILFRSIGLARLGQERWKEAEEPLQKAISLFDEQIEKASKSDSEFWRTGHANNLRMSEDSALTYLAAAFARQERFAEALVVLERAYAQATQFSVPAKLVNDIVLSGRMVSLIAGDNAAAEKWSGRALKEEANKK